MKVSEVAALLRIVIFSANALGDHFIKVGEKPSGNSAAGENFGDIHFIFVQILTKFH